MADEQPKPGAPAPASRRKSPVRVTRLPDARERAEYVLAAHAELGRAAGRDEDVGAAAALDRMNRALVRENARLRALVIAVATAREVDELGTGVELCQREHARIRGRAPR